MTKLPSFAVQYDTNVYRGLSDAKLNEIVQAEKARGIKVTANRIVLEELLSHVAERDPRELKYYLPAVRRLVRHCLVNGELLISPSREEIFDAIVLGIVPETDSEANHRLAALHCWERAPDDWPPDVVAWLRALVVRVRADETSFQDYMTLKPRAASEILSKFTDLPAGQSKRDAVKAYLRDKVGTWGVAEGLVRTLVERHSTSIADPADFTKCVEKAQRVFIFACDWYLEMCLKHIVDGYDFRAKKNINDMWDWLLLFAVPNGETIGDVPFVLVTKEERLHNVAKARGTDRICDYNRYVVMLGLPHLIDT